jgi:hypothetical protein
VTFAKPIDQELVVDIDFCTLNQKSAKDIESLYLVCREGWIKSVLGEYHIQKQALSRFYLAAMILSDPVVQLLRRELKRLSPDVRVQPDEIRTALVTEVLKREVTEGDQLKEAKKKIAKASTKLLKKKQSLKDGEVTAEDSTCSSEVELEALDDTTAT